VTQITFIGGGSVQWIPDLINDIALTPTLAQAHIVLQDIDPGALQRMLPVARRIIQQCGAQMRVSATLDRQKALRQADFVVLCVSVGGLQAMRGDLEIPLKYGIHQSVGDTVGPGGLARGLRHIPFAVQVVQEMEELCPQAWLLNLTNPMTVICRAVSKATSVRVIGLCHEAAGVRAQLAGLLKAPLEKVTIKVAGVNHLPVVVDFRVGERDGMVLLREYLAQHDLFASIDRSPMTSAYQVFYDQLALKLELFKETGILYGAGDRHIAEFFSGLLTEETQLGMRYGIRLTTVDHRLEMMRTNRDSLADFTPKRAVSSEQLAPVMASLLGGPAGCYVVNIPNDGQIDNLPRQAVVECMAYVDQTGVWPLTLGGLPEPAQSIVAGHIQRQEWIVEAGLTGQLQWGRKALVADPLVIDRAENSDALFAELMQANKRTLEDAQRAIADRTLEIEEQLFLETVDERSSSMITQEAKKEFTAPISFSVDHSTIGDLLANEDSRAVLVEQLPGILEHPQVKMAYGMTLRAVARYAPFILTKKKLQAIDDALRALEPKT
jgi:alpha-galactosidase